MIANFPERLKSARKMAGLSMEALAERSGKVVTKQAIGKYEKGRMQPTGEVLAAMSSALGVKPGYFFRPPGPAALKKPEFRRKAKLSATEKGRIEHQGLDFLERYLEIEDILDERVDFSNPIPENMRKVEALEDVEHAAGELRRRWELGQAPISNLMEILEERGIRLFELDASETFHGLSAWAGDTPLIAIRRQDDLLRQRFTIAHELGHMLLDFEQDCEGRAREKRCHDFAGALLLPREVILNALGRKRAHIDIWEAKRIKGIYGISIQATITRAYRLGIIEEGTFKRFWIKVSREGWKKDEPGQYVGREKANRFDQLVRRAVVEGVISASKGAELLNKPLAEFRDSLRLVA